MVKAESHCHDLFFFDLYLFSELLKEETPPNQESER